jgi:hypothetical protein
LRYSASSLSERGESTRAIAAPAVSQLLSVAETTTAGAFRDDVAGISPSASGPQALWLYAGQELDAEPAIGGAFTGEVAMVDKSHRTGSEGSPYSHTT